jgi:glucose/arabinose dehydrogenase
VQRIVFTPRGLVGRETLLGELRQRIRDVREGPDGFLYVVTDANPGGLLRIEPAPPPSGGGR